MLLRETMINDIRKGLAAIQEYVRPGGTLNLTDTNVHAEAFVAGLLNSIHDWHLVSTNQAKANFPCIDLIDERLGLGVQVTAETGSGKLTDTVERVTSHGLVGTIKHLKVFLLVPKQAKYTVKAACPGIEFDWQDDVLDFDDAIRSAQAIGSLQQLRRVHSHVVDSLPFFFPEYRQDPLPLFVPATDPAKAWLAFSSRATNLVGREKEQAYLSKFLDSESNFAWLLVTGDAGSGKSRLALELCRQAGEGWHAGFLSRTETNVKWSQFSPSRKTLIVIDYVASRAAEVSNIVLTLSRTSSSFAKQVRILLVEREKRAWWATFIREDSQSESAEMTAWQYANPLELPSMSLDAVLQIAREVVLSRNGTWNAEVARDFLQRMYRYDREGRPLFAMIVALYLEAVEIDAAEPNLLQAVLKREAARRSQLLQQRDELRRMENLLLLASLVSGLEPKSGSYNHLAVSNIAGLLPNVALLDQALYCDIASSASGNSGATLAGLQPDILGERFVLDRLAASGIAGQNARALLLAAWCWQPNDVRIVTLRCVADFQGDPAIHTLFDLPLDTVDARRYWADMVADFIPYAGESDENFSNQQQRKLIAIADSHPHEADLRDATARAYYHRALQFMFDDNSIAIEQFDSAIARAGKDSLIAKMAMHNRVILQRADDKNYDPFKVFTMVIDSHDAPDELRACAFNNRADLYVERGEHDHAIQDRSEVLALKRTHPDRRYIALFRRSRSYAALGSVQAALDDLSRILDIWDVSQEQKSEARLERAAIMRQLEHWDEARTDLEAVVASESLFKGMRAVALVDLADVSRITGEHALAGRLLNEALKDSQISKVTRIDAMIVAGLLLEDSDDAEGACECWQRVVATPTASDDQIRFARSRLDAISHRKAEPGR